MCLPCRVPPCGGSSITEIINPNYMGVGAFGHMKQTLSPDQQPTAWSYDQPLKDPSLGPGRGESPPTPPSQPPISPKKISKAPKNSKSFYLESYPPTCFRILEHCDDKQSGAL